MNSAFLQVVKNECEKIQKSSNHGEVVIKILPGKILLKVINDSVYEEVCEKQVLDIVQKR